MMQTAAMHDPFACLACLGVESTTLQAHGQSHGRPPGGAVPQAPLTFQLSLSGSPAAGLPVRFR